MVELPVAERLQDSPTSQFRIQPTEDPMVARVRARSPLSAEQIEAYRLRRKKTPVGVWITIVSGAVIALILLLLLALNG